MLSTHKTHGISFLGAVATSDVDYVNGTFSMNVDIGDQDVTTVCQSIQINSDNVIERTEYFTVSLRRTVRDRKLATCQVAIIDRNGGKYQYHQDYYCSNFISKYSHILLLTPFQ